MSELVDLGALHPALVRLERPAASSTPGLSRAIGARFTVDPLLIRMFFVLLTPVGGVGAVVYVWGVLLTPRQGRKSAPISRLLPQFGSWAPRTQWLGIGVSSVLAAAAVSRIVPISALPLLLLGLAVVLVKRHRSPVGPGTQQVEHGPQLPVVDLYAPEPVPTPPPQPSRTPVRVSWLGALGVVILAVLSYPLFEVLLGSRFLAVAGALGVAGVVTTGWALVIRSRRLPTAFLLALLLVAGGFGTLAHLRESTGHPLGVPEGQELMANVYVGDSAVLDLRELESEEFEGIVHVEALASEVRILLANAPADVEISRTLSDVELVPVDGATAPPASGVRLRISATVSEVTVEYPR